MILEIETSAESKIYSVRKDVMTLRFTLLSVFCVLLCFSTSLTCFSVTG